MANAEQQKLVKKRRRMVLETLGRHGSAATSEYVVLRYNKMMRRGELAFKLPADLHRDIARSDLNYMVEAGLLRRISFMDEIAGDGKMAGMRLLWELTKKGALVLSREPTR